MDFCQRFGPEIAYCLKQPLCGYNVNITCVCEYALLFPWGAMACVACMLCWHNMPLCSLVQTVVCLQFVYVLL